MFEEIFQQLYALAQVTPQDVNKAVHTLRGCIHQTPLLTSDLMNAWLNQDGCNETQHYFKAECFQRTGSFKIRGALNAVRSSTETGPLVTHSSGNHGQALALAARLSNRDSYIVVPSSAPKSKINALLEYGANIELCEPSMDDRKRVSADLVKRVNGELIHPYLTPHVIAGQGTIALEILDQLNDDVDVIIVSVGGGGLISGICIAIKQRYGDRVKIVGVESVASNSGYKSLQAGQKVECTYGVETVGDAIKASIGEVAWFCLKHKLIDKMISVTEAGVKESMKMVWERMKVVIEGAAAVSVAGAKTKEFRELGCKKVAIVLCGGNVDLNQLPW